MSASAIGIIMFLIMVGLILVGVPIFVSMLSCSIVGFYLCGGAKMVFVQLTPGAIYIRCVLLLRGATTIYVGGNIGRSNRHSRGCL